MSLVQRLQRTMCATLTVCFLVPPSALYAADPNPSHDGFLPNREAGRLDLFGLEHIDVEPTTGTLVLSRNDLVLGEGDERFAVRRTYSPWSGNQRHMGHHWVSTLDQRLDFQPGGRLAVFNDADGYPHAFLKAGAGYRAVEGRLARIDKVGNGWQLTGLGDERVYRFDDQGRLRVRSGAGGTVRYRYDRAGRLGKVQGPWGELTLGRDWRGFLSTITGPGGERVTYARDVMGNLREVRRGSDYQPYGYDRQGRLVSIAGGMASVRYDAQGRVVALTGRGVAPVTLRYLPAVDRRGPQTVVVRGGMTHKVFVSASGRRIERVTPDGTSHVTQLDRRNRPVRLSTAGVTWTWSYDERGRLSKTTSPDGVATFRYGSSATDRPTEIRLADGRVVRNQYDLRGNLVAATFPGKGTTRYAYDNQGRIARMTDARGAVTRLKRNARGYIVAIHQDGIGTTRIRRNAMGELVGIKGPDGRITKLSDTATGRLVRVEDQRGLIWEAEYDRRGQLIRSVDELGLERFYRWNLRGNMIEARDREGLLATFRYDAAGRFAEIRDGAGAKVTYERPDPRTLIVRDDSSGKRTVTYDRLGRIASETKGRDRIAYAYDARGKLATRTTPRGVERFSYDAAGRMSRMKGPDGGYAFGYDRHGRLNKLTNEVLKQSITYRYNAAGDRVGMTLPWGEQKYAVDAQGRVSGITTPEGKTIKIEHAKDGRRTAIRYPNGVVTRFVYKQAQLMAVETRRGKKLIDRRAYTYDRRGRVATTTDHRGNVTRYARDFRGRLTRVESRRGTVEYRYDKAGNRIGEKKNGKEIATKIGRGNRLLQRGEQRYRYGRTGALTEVDGPEGTTRYHYDQDDRLIRVERPDGAVVRYGYAPNGTRMWQTGPEGRVDYLNDLADVVGEYRNGKVRTRFVHGSGDDDVLAATRGTKTHYYHYDLVRSVTSMTNSRGKVSARYAYDAFGKTERAAGKVAKWNPYRYTSRQWNAGTQTYHYRARNYDPSQGRFMSPDPFGREGGLNLYSYVENDPTLFNDPYGLWPGWLDRAVEKGKSIVKRAAKSVVRVAKKAWNKLPEGIKKPLKVGAAFVKGFGKGLWSGAKGIWNMVTDPVGTYNAMKWAVQNWDKVKAALGDKWEEYKDAFFNDPEKFAEMTGVIAGEITIGLVGTKGLDKLAKVGAVAKAAQVIAKPVKTVGSKIAGATAPVRRAAAPVLNQAARVVRPVAKGVGTVAKPVIWTGKQIIKPLDKTADVIVNTAAWGLRKTGQGVGAAGRAAGRRIRGRPIPAGAGAGAGAAVVPKSVPKASGNVGARGILEGEKSAARAASKLADEFPVGKEINVPRSDGTVSKGVVEAIDGDRVVVRVPTANGGTGTKALRPETINRYNPTGTTPPPASTARRPLTNGDPVWDTPLGTNKDKLGNFKGIEGQPVDEILSRIPENATRRTLKPEPGKVTEGYEWKWVDDDGVTNRLRIHGPDASAPPGSNSASGWSARHQKGGKYADNDGTFHPRGVHNEKSPHYNPDAGNATHIPIEGNPTAKLPASNRPGAPVRGSPAASKQSLDNMLDDVWKQRDELAGQGYRPIYRKYNAVTEPNPLSVDGADYLDDIAKLSRNRPDGAVSNSQGAPWQPLDDLAKTRRVDGPNPKIDNTFYRFERSNWQPDKITERVYVNASADHAPEIMNRVVRDIIDNPGQYPGVEMAKISGPGAVGNRAENIVIYTQDAAASQRVLDAVSAMQKQNPGWFQNSVPQMTNRVAPGVATGAEPVMFAGQESFGSVRAKAISQALERTMREGGDQAAFSRNVAEELKKFGVDPNAPHTNLPTN